MARVEDLLMFMGLEDNMMVIDILREVLVDEMDENIGRHMEIHILDGKRTHKGSLKYQHLCNLALRSFSFSFIFYEDLGLMM